VTSALVITEGVDDLRALREVFMRQFEMQRDRAAVRQFRGPGEVLVSTDGARRVHLGNGRDRGRAARRAAEALREPSSYDRIGLVFDPDTDSDERWQRWLEREVLEGLAPDPLDCVCPT